MSDTGDQDIAQVKIEYKIRINYKSGHQHVGWFSQFTVKRASDGSVAEVEYTTSDGTNFLIIGIDGIESITQLTHRKKAVVK